VVQDSLVLAARHLSKDSANAEAKVRETLNIGDRRVTKLGVVLEAYKARKQIANGLNTIAREAQMAS
jgi:hypothetical protein